MKDYLDEIDSRFPVRNMNAQKEAFREYVSNEASSFGYTVQTVQNDTHNNIVIGNPEEAFVVFTAHYDTPRRALLPNLLIPLNPVLKYIWALIPVFAMLALAIVAAFVIRDITGLHGIARLLVVYGTYLLVYFGLFQLLFRGPANKRNRNDNTSGTAAVLTLCQKLAGNGKAAFILFDNEEKGKKGSKAYANAFPGIRNDRLIVNMDCVGNGNNWIVSASDAAMNDPIFAILSEVMERMNASIYPSRKADINSDQKNFDKGIGICACLHRRWIGFYTPRIHTRYDTVASSDNIFRLSDSLAAFIEQL